MRCRRRSLLHLLAATTLATTIGSATPALAEIKGLEILAPSSPGSGYDQLARTMQTVLQTEKLANGIQMVNVSGGERQPGLKVPTLEAGVDVALVNWRGVALPGDVRPADKKAVGEAIAAMVKSPSWQEALTKRGRLDLYQPADAFAPFLAEQQAQIEGVLKDIGLVQ